LILNVIKEHTAMKTLQNYRTVEYLLVIQQNSKKSEAELLVIIDEWLQVIIEEFQFIFRLTLSDKLSPKQMFKHSINISNIKSVNINAYSLSQLQLNKQAKQIMKLLNKGLICEFTSSWSFSVLFIKKKKSTWQMCIDYRALNNITVKNEMNEKLHSVIYDGQKLQDTELNYSVYKKKLLIIKHALQTWQYYIKNDHTTTIIMNHEDLQYLKNTSHSFKQLAQWINKFQ